MSYISAYLVDQVSRGVSQTTVNEISALQNNIRSLLQQGYETFLQGSYANDTSISDINDVDIVAIERPLLGFLPSIGTSSNLFYDIKSKLETNSSYRGRVTIGRKCLTVTLANRKADIVPALRASGVTLNRFNEPIVIAQQIRNYPKTHISSGQAKNQRTNNNYKRVVRMVKNYVNNWNLDAVAPSFYVECMIYSYTDTSFSNDLMMSLNNILSHMTGSNFDPNFMTVAGDKNVISQTEWNPQSFIAFRNHIINNLQYLNAALILNDETHANANFRKFYNL